MNTIYCLVIVSLVGANVNCMPDRNNFFRPNLDPRQLNQEIFDHQLFRPVHNKRAVRPNNGGSGNKNSKMHDLHNIVANDGRLCTSQIYCYGPLLHTVQMARLTKDSKYFVDQKLKFSPNKTIDMFNDFMKKTNSKPSREEIQHFVDSAFDPVESEFEPSIPVDWTEHPSVLKRISDSGYRQFAIDLNNIWHTLGRKMKNEVADNQELYSIIYVPNTVIIPGGRFREFYYWDSYWIIRGLLVCDMHQTVKGMLENFLSIIERIGFIPNGGRIYYAARSQPPIFALMVKEYVEKTGDLDFAIQAVETLDKEFQFFQNNRMHNVNGHQLAAYGSSIDATGPRPESYREDYEMAQKLPTPEQQHILYAELQAGAESGMDYTSRWFINANGTNEGHLDTINARSVIPVELNVFLCLTARTISEFYLLANNPKKAIEYSTKALELQDAIDKVLWNDEEGIWLDYDLHNKKQRNYFSGTNLSPLWNKVFNQAQEGYITEKVLNYIEKNNLEQYPGGVPNTLANTGEQWDFPNVWPPIQHILIEGLSGLNSPEAKLMAMNWAQRWVRNNYITYQKTQGMFEKYNAEEVGGQGGGGEYEVQKGFGWTNGVVLDLLNRFGGSLTSGSHI